MANIDDIKQIITAADACGQVPLIEGLHGIGKSEGVYQYAKENNMHYEPLILSLMDTGDMLGMPDTVEVSGILSTVWAAPSWYTNIVNAAWPELLPTKELVFADADLAQAVSEHLREVGGVAITRNALNAVFCTLYDLPNDRLHILRQDKVRYTKAKRSVLNLDEFNRAPTDILNASLQLILDHRLHTHILPLVDGKETLIVAAVNPASGNYTVHDFDPALLDRFVVIEATADYPSWAVYARKNNVNQIVIDFIGEDTNKFHFTPEDGTKGASPRSWTRLAKYIDYVTQSGGTLQVEYVKGTIGSALSARFINFFNTYSNAVTQKDFDKEIKKEIKKAEKVGEVNPEELAATLFSEKASKLDAILRGEYAHTFVEQYINKEGAADAMPMLVYLYSLPVESLSAVLKSLQSSNAEAYTKLAVLDKEANNKGLFKKLISLKK